MISLLDDDFYKFTMQQAALELYPNVIARHKFINRGKQKFNDKFMDNLDRHIKSMSHLNFIREEVDYIDSLGVFKPWYLDYLKGYRFKPKEVKYTLKDGNLELETYGVWHSSIMWEVPLLSIISELYFRYVDTNWEYNPEQYRAKTNAKAQLFNGCGPIFSEFGTRRRRSYQVQKDVVQELKQFPSFMGTSNVLLSMENGLIPIGTMAHEWIQAHSALCSLRHANRYALQAWHQVYQGKLGIALTDTYGTDAFLKDFDYPLALLYGGLRQDSACPFEWADKVNKHLEKLDVNKKAAFTDSLDFSKAVKIKNYCKDTRLDPFFGIGTNLTNDFENSPALSIVIKMIECEGVPVVKLSDAPDKASGDPDALKVARWTFFNESITKESNE